MDDIHSFTVFITNAYVQMALQVIFICFFHFVHSLVRHSYVPAGQPPVTPSGELPRVVPAAEQLEQRRVRQP